MVKRGIMKYTVIFRWLIDEKAVPIDKTKDIMLGIQGLNLTITLTTEDLLEKKEIIELASRVISKAWTIADVYLGITNKIGTYHRITNTWTDIDNFLYTVEWVDRSGKFNTTIVNDRYNCHLASVFDGLEEKEPVSKYRIIGETKVYILCEEDKYNMQILLDKKKAKSK